MLFSLLVFACSGGADKGPGSDPDTSDTSEPVEETVTALGTGDGALDPDSVIWTPILGEDDDLDEDDDEYRDRE